MRKNLFLTLALSLASFVGINAQSWTATLGTEAGLPGAEIVKDGVTVCYFKSGLIKTNKAITKLRFTVTDTQGGAEVNGFKFFTLSELNILKVDGKTEVKYTPTSNADHNTLSGSQDGQGLKALTDGKYATYFHSVWDEKTAPKEYHYVELELAEPISEFIIEWAGRGARPNQAPKTVVLTDGADAVPYADRDFKHGGKITDLAELAKVTYITIQGNAATTYQSYNNQTGEKGDLKTDGVGPKFTVYDDIVADEPTSNFVAQLIPVEGKENTYYIYYPERNTWLNKTGTAKEGSFNTGQNGWQGSCSSKNDAAEVVIATHKNGGFTMSYQMENKNLAAKDKIVYIGADPRHGKMKTFPTEGKNNLETKGWTSGFSFACAFNWTFYKAEYKAPTWNNAYQLSLIYHDAIALKSEFGEHELIDEAIQAAADALKNTDDFVTVQENIDNINYLLSEYLFQVLFGDDEDGLYYQYEADFQNKYLGNSSTSGNVGTYPQVAYDTYIKANILNAFYTLLENVRLYDVVDQVRKIANGVEENIKKMEASKLDKKQFPITGEFLYDDDDKTATLKVFLAEKAKEIRITMHEARDGHTSIFSMSEFEILDNNGVKLGLKESDITTNSIETAETGIASMLDGENTTYYHSAWTGNAITKPEGAPVYLDIKFPDAKELEAFTIKVRQRDGQPHQAPKRITVSEYGAQPKEIVNNYNVRAPKQITDPNDLKADGIYLISGNLYAKSDGKAPCYYSGTSRFAEKQSYALGDSCVYMLKQVEGGWNIVSLVNGQYWGAEGGMTIFQNKAAVVKIEKSENISNTMVIYSPINEKKTASFKPEKDTDAGYGIDIPAQEVTVTALVFMDWESGLATRPCVSAQPGVFEYGIDQLDDDLISKSGAGDALHFNKTNGEGEWNIYEVSMDSPEYLWLTGIAPAMENSRIEIGKNPGCVKVDEATAAAYNNVRAEADAVVEANQKTKGKETLNKLLAVLDKLSNAELVAIAPEVGYLINSDFSAYYTNTGSYRSMHVAKKEDATVLAWSVTPEEFLPEYIFKFKPISQKTAKELELSEEDAKHAYHIYSGEEGSELYLETGATSQQVTITDDIEYAGTFIAKSMQGTSYIIYDPTATDHKELHTQGHSGGNGTQGEIVYYNEGRVIDNQSRWNLIIAEDYYSAVEEVIAEGDEVVATAIYSTSGVANSKLEKGINIVVKVYANGVVETQKVLVK
ncbi:MAG: hypothetical protein J6U58_06655 [Bacteroidaceae bacterium]|nr:hypothetical protein [Bacteroidaceae bacterium]